MKRIFTLAILIFTLAILILLAPTLLSSSLAQGVYVPPQNIEKGTANNQTARWDGTAEKWVPVSGASLDSSGNLTAASVTAGGNLLSAYTLPVATTTGLGGVSVPALGGLTVSGGGALSEAQPITGIGSGLSLVNGLLSNTYSFSLPSVGTAGTYAYPSSLTTDAQGRVTAVVAGSAPTGGTVTSVGLSLPSIFSVSGSPITLSGTLSASLATQSANTVWAGPASGGAAAPGFRGLVGADLSGAGISSDGMHIGIGGSYNSTYPLAVTGNLYVSAVVGTNQLVASGVSSIIATKDSTTGLTVSPPSTTGAGINVKALAGQTGHIINFSSATGTGDKGYVDAAGNMVIGNQLSVQSGPIICAALEGNSAGTNTVILNTTGTSFNLPVTAPAVLTAIATKTSAYTATTTDQTILLDTTGGTFPLTLPSAATAGSGHPYTLKWIAGSVAPTVSGVVDGGTLTFSTLNQYAQIVSNGTAYYKIGGN